MQQRLPAIIKDGHFIGRGIRDDKGIADHECPLAHLGLRLLIKLRHQLR